MNVKSILLILSLIIFNTPFYLNGSNIIETYFSQCENYKNKSLKILAINVSGSNAAKIYQVTINDSQNNPQQFICKELKDKKSEHSNLQTLSSFTEDYLNQTKDLYQAFRTYPAIARFKSSICDDNFLLFEHASGESVINIMKYFMSRDYGDQGNDVNYEKRKVLQHFTNIGKAVARFHLMYGEYNSSTKSFNTIIHGDLHLSNVFYDLVLNTTTFIDYETMANSLQVKKNSFVDVFRMLNFASKNLTSYIIERAGEKFMRNRNVIFLDQHLSEEKSLFINAHLTKLDSFYNAIAKGYKDHFLQAGYTYNIFNGQVDKNS